MRFPFSKPKLEDLDHYIARKEYDKALAAVGEALKKNPQQFNLLLRQADILALVGDRSKAVGMYRNLAKRYARDGFYAKAIALYKKVLRLDPRQNDVHAELARLIDEDRKSKRPVEERLGLRPAAPGGKGPSAQHLKELRASQLFGQFDRETLEQLLSSTSLRSYRSGELIVREGDAGSSLFLIVAGHVKVFTQAEDGNRVFLAELGPGDFFGEVSLLTGKPRTATIEAAEHVAAIELDKASVDQISQRQPQVRKILEEFYTRRAQETVEAVIRKLRHA